MKKKQLKPLNCLLLIILGLCLNGCALGKKGSANPSYITINLPDGLNGQSKEQIVKRLGVPEYVLQEGELEYWGYENKRGWYLYIPVTKGIGVSQAKKIELAFSKGKVIDSFLREQSFSWGLIPQGGVGN